MLAPLTGLPNASYPSDHLPLVFGFRFKKSEAFTTRLPFDDPAGATSATDGDGGDGDSKRHLLLPDLTYFDICVRELASVACRSTSRPATDMLVGALELRCPSLDSQTWSPARV